MNEKCPGIACPSDRPVAYYWPTNDGCFCEIENFFALPWNYLLPDEDRIDMKGAKSILEVDRNEFLLQDAIEARVGAQAEVSHTWSRAPLSMLNRKMAATTETNQFTEDEAKVYKRQDISTTSPTQVATNTIIPTFVPPPKKDLTPELLNQSLSIQHQNKAKVASVIAHLADAVIGSNPLPNIMLVPKYVQGGTQQIIIANCRCIAVNQLKPDLVNWWILNQDDGSLYSLAGLPEVTDIDKIVPGAPVVLTMIASSVSPSKREGVAAASIVELPRRQVLKANVCDRRCPGGMEPIPGDLLKNPPECGCLAQEASELKGLATRGLSAPGPYTVTMDEAACKAMKCTNNNNKPPMWNPFDLQCWCAGPTYVEDSDSAWTPGGSAKT